MLLCVTVNYKLEYKLAKNLSIRNVPMELEKAILREAKRHGTTKTEVVLKALKEVFQLEKKRGRVQRDIRTFFGKMTISEYRDFVKETKEFSIIDAEMWK